jgi:hypothetical protein
VPGGDRVPHAGGDLARTEIGAECVYRDDCDGPSSEEAFGTSTCRPA